MLCRAAALVIVFTVLMPVGAGAATDDEPPDGLLLALDARSGRERWRSTTPGFFAIEDVSRSRVVGRGFPCYQPPRETIAYATSNGARKWRGPAVEYHAGSRGGERLATGANLSGVVVVQRANEVQGRDVRTGSVRWRVPVDGDVYTSVSATAAFLVEFTERTTTVVSARDRRSGDELWSRADLRPAPGWIVAADAHAAVATMSTDLLANGTAVLDSTDGRTAWSTDEVLQSAGAFVVATMPEHDPPRLTTIVRDAASGEELWSHPGPGWPGWVAAGRIGIASEESFTVFDARTGRALWTRVGPEDAVGSLVPLAFSSRLAVLRTGRTEVSVVDASTGRDRWTVSLPATKLNLGAAIAGDRVYVTAGCHPND